MGARKLITVNPLSTHTNINWRESRRTVEEIVRLTTTAIHDVGEDLLVKLMKVHEICTGLEVEAGTYHELIINLHNFCKEYSVRMYYEDNDNMILADISPNMNSATVWNIMEDDLNFIPEYLHPTVKAWMHEIAIGLEYTITDEWILEMILEDAFGEDTEEEKKEKQLEHDNHFAWITYFKTWKDDDWRKHKIKFKNNSDRDFIHNLITMDMDPPQIWQRHFEEESAYPTDLVTFTRNNVSFNGYEFNGEDEADSYVSMRAGDVLNNYALNEVVLYIDFNQPQDMCDQYHIVKLLADYFNSLQKYFDYVNAKRNQAT